MTDQQTTATRSHLQGLTSEEAAARLLEHGPNEPAPVSRASVVREFAILLLNPLVSILLVASLASFLLRDATDATIILVIVLLSAAINFAQTYRSRRSIEKLRENVTPTATVLRDGNWCEIARRSVVPGDLTRLCAGDLVPADGELIESRDLYVQQAALTGESLPAEKNAGSDGVARLEDPENQRAVFLGTSVVSGTGLMVVQKTGTQTVFGQIAKRLVGRPDETEFDRSLRRFGLLIMRTVFFLVLFILATRVALHRDAFESLVFAVALAVGLTPEFLPMISSVTLARGAMRMAQEQVVVKHLSAIQNFGTVDVLCSDKTGTLTTGQMTLVSSVNCFGAQSDLPLTLAYLNAEFESGVRSPLDTAILYTKHRSFDVYTKCDELPFDFERRRVSVILEHKFGQILIAKGAPEGILSICTEHESEGQQSPVDGDTERRARETFHSLSEQGLRVLAVAYREVGHQGAFTLADESSLVLAGFVTFADPASPDAKDSISALKRDGVNVKILTGDNELVARHVCEQVGLPDPSILVGDEIEKMTEPALQHAAEETTVFARVSPMQKYRIIHALKHRNHVVGFLGDGINDAPSLRAADVGISVASAVDVAREAADIILLKPGLNTLHKGILEGRRASANVLKYLLMGTSSNFGNMFSMAAASLFLPFLPMLPTQILLNNFLYDTAQITIPSDNVDDAYIREPRRWDMHLIRNFMIFIGPISSIYDFLTFYVLLRYFHAKQAEFHTGWFVESLATQTLVLFVIRTMGNPLRSRPSAALTTTTFIVVAVGLFLPYSPVASFLGFTPLPRMFFVFLGIYTVTYLLLVEWVKRLLFSARQE